jgi:hypothetical protein
MSGLAISDGSQLRNFSAVEPRATATNVAVEPRAIRQPLDEEAMRRATWATILAGHEAIEIVIRNREPLNRNQARQLLRTGKRLSNAVAVLQPLGKHHRVERVRHLLGLAMTLAQWQQRWPR